MISESRSGDRMNFAVPVPSAKIAANFDRQPGTRGSTMLERLFKTKAAGLGQDARVPAGRRVYAIGDIHGRLDLLQALHGRIERDAADAPDLDKTVLYLGDYVDRGMKSRQVIDYLLDPPLPGFQAVHLGGNHEAVMLKFLVDAGVGPLWLRLGGDMTLFSYGIALALSDATPELIEEARVALRESLPRRHFRFLRRLRRTHAEGDYLFVHAGIRPGVPLDEQEADDLIWIRDKFLASKADHGKVVVHGHSPVEEVQFRDNRISIDTRAYATGRLTALVLEGATRRLLDTAPAKISS